MQDNQEKCKELAIRIYNLDEEVYKCVGSSLGRTFTGQKETTLRHLAALMYTKPDGHLLRSELALISNMARTIRDKSERRRLMIEYDSIHPHRPGRGPLCEQPLRQGGQDGLDARPVPGGRQDRGSQSGVLGERT